MLKEQLTAQAVACWISLPQNKGRDLLREALPAMDVEWMFRALKLRSEFDASNVSLAIAGFDLSAVDLEEIHRNSGLELLHALTDDLHVAAEWRNNRNEHPVIISLAKGWHPGVSTLDHFGTAASKDLTVILLDWAELESSLPENNLERELLRALKGEEISKLISLNSVCSYLEAWFSLKESDPLDAPRVALSHLGLFSDPELFSRSGNIESRLLMNFKIASQVKEAAATTLRAIERRLIQRFRRDLETRDRLLNVCEQLARVRLYPSVEEMAGITLTEAQEVFRPPPDQVPESDAETPDDDAFDDNQNGNSSSGGTRGGRLELVTATGDDLLDDNQASLTGRIESLESSLEEAIEQDEKQVEVEVEIGDEEMKISIDLDHELLDWLHSYCNTEAFGGLIKTNEPSVSDALKLHASCSPLKVEPHRIAILDGREMDLRQIFADWDDQLNRRGHEVNILSDWDDFVSYRTRLIEHLDALFLFPLDWMAGRPELAIVVENYLFVATRLYNQVQSQYRNMGEIDQGWAEIGLNGLLALDVMQIRCMLEDDRESWKAILLPTHPLSLWRYQRLTAVLRGLGNTLETDDRKAIIDECRRPEQFLSVLFVSSLPENKGGSRLLPISSDLHGLATFENLQNACSGLDGVNTLRYAIDRFAVTNRIHLRPLRVGVLNPPNAPKLVVELCKILSERRESTLPTMLLELYSTTAPAVRGRAAQALAFSSETMDLIETRLASGRLELKIHEQPRPLDDWIAYWRQEPLHLLILFDEAGVSIRRSDMALPMPMSPFCVRKIIRYQELRGTLKLDPTTDSPPFSEFMLLMNEADRGQRDSMPNAWAEEEVLRQTVDQVLQGTTPGAFWLVMADRIQPTESGLTSVRLLARREGQRELLLMARDYSRLAEMVRPAFNRWHLHVTQDQLSKLLEDGVHLTGAGILNLVKKDGTVDANQVLGLAGTLLAARDYVRRYPGALVVSADHQVARHWLRLGQKSERCDLITMRQEGEGVVIETIEVKSTERAVGEISAATLDQAQRQLAATLEAIADGLTGVDSECGPLSVPRCEMLKEVLVRGCFGKQVTNQQKGMWCGWLKRIFRQEGDPISVTLKGLILRVALGESRFVAVEEVPRTDPPISIQTLCEAEVQRLLDETENTENQQVNEETSFQNLIPPSSTDPELQTSMDRSETPTPEDTITETTETIVNSADIADEIVNTHQSSNNTHNESFTDWPPQPNELGMIGQDETVRELINRLHYSRDFHQRFKDTMFVGSAGVGKSSFARAIADQLLGQTPIMFSGADLRTGRMIIEKLDTQNKVPQGDERPIRLLECVVFIDEVHALPPSVANIMLSALDDARLTTIDNIDYDFGEVVFLMATTDAGKLTEAFRSRPDRVLLRNYTLEELAGILWLHGQEELDGFQLPHEVCREIAARTRAQPRVAVRMLTNQLIPHFYAAVRDTGGSPNRFLIGEAMNLGAVEGYFENQGIDTNGLDPIARSFLSYLSSRGATAEERLRQGLGISNRGDFVEVDEYLQRLGLVTVRGGRTLTPEGRRYIQSPSNLRHRISRQR